jgi:WD40 repeat protein
VDAEGGGELNSPSSSSCRSCSGKAGGKVDRVKVRHYRKRSKELSAVYRGQEIKAHKGAIVTMRFSCDGQYLATGGEDGAVRVWRVVEGERPDELDFAEDDPSCVFFTVNGNSELAPVNSSEGSKSKDSKSSKGVADPACVVIPHRTFALSQVPVHEFYGHGDAVLDLSWSRNGVSGSSTQALFFNLPVGSIHVMLIYHYLLVCRTCFLLLWIKLFDCGGSGLILVSRFSTTLTMVNPLPP